MGRRIAIAIPARNEAEALPGCLRALATAADHAGLSRIHVVVLANNCDDDTAGVAARLDLGPRLIVDVIERELSPKRAHAGWSRRLALDAAADRLRGGGDLLLSTDADTLVAEDWLARTAVWFDRGYDAVAGLARLRPRELRRLPRAHRARLAAIRRYDHAIGRLKAARDGGEPWPRHFYEGGASIALTHAAYRATGGAPTPSVGEDKALFDAVRRTGGRVRHPVDVRVMTSPRLIGRAAGGTSDTLALWGRLANDEAVFGLKTIAEHLELQGAEARGLTFRELPDEMERARGLVRAARRSQVLAEAG
jgi:cellulose synthase/poly-beta-1,6-N-acetylglucosamine synthase-like glycosyltransferase